MNARIYIASFEGDIEVEFAIHPGEPCHIRFGRHGFVSGNPETPLELEVESIEFFRTEQPARPIPARFRRLPRGWRHQIERAVWSFMDGLRG